MKNAIFWYLIFYTFLKRDHDNFIYAWTSSRYAITNSKIFNNSSFGIVGSREQRSLKIHIYFLNFFWKLSIFILDLYYLLEVAFEANRGWNHEQGLKACCISGWPVEFLQFFMLPFIGYVSLDLQGEPLLVHFSDEGQKRPKSDFQSQFSVSKSNGFFFSFSFHLRISETIIF